MFFLTDKHIMFVSKTDANVRWWKAAVERQILNFSKTPSTMITHDGYDEKKLHEDLENEKNEVFSISDIVSAESEEKAWGTVLKLKIKQGEKVKNYHLSIVRDWVGYPIRDPMKFLKVDWDPIVDYIQKKRAAS